MLENKAPRNLGAHNNIFLLYFIVPEVLDSQLKTLHLHVWHLAEIVDWHFCLHTASPNMSTELSHSKAVTAWASYMTAGFSQSCSNTKKVEVVGSLVFAQSWYRVNFVRFHVSKQWSNSPRLTQGKRHRHQLATKPNFKPASTHQTQPVWCQ